MRLTVLGCRSGMPADGQCSSSYLVESESTKLLLDCGPGALTALSSMTRPQTLDAVVVSHFHLDHCYDLLPLGKALLAGRAHAPGSAFSAAFPTLPNPVVADLPPVPLYVPKGGRETLRILATLFPVTTIPLLDKAFEVAFDVREYVPGDAFVVGDCAISMHGLRHAVTNCGTRVEGPGGSIAYTGDTGVTDDLIPFARGVDLLLAEATLEVSDTSEHGHLCAADAGDVARSAQVGQLVLTHFATTDKGWLQARKADAERAYDGLVRLATPAARFEI